jgi:hypothetical protein
MSDGTATMPQQLPVQISPVGSRYFVNAPVDFLLIGGASIALYVALKVSPSLASSASLGSLAATLVWVCNYPHFASSSFRLYHSRAASRQYPLTAWLIPVVMIAGVAGCYVSPNVVAPMFVKLYLFWSPYHFSGQTVGITMIYARRSGYRIERWGRTALSWFVFSTFAVQSAWAELAIRTHSVRSLTGGRRAYFGVTFGVLGVPTWVPTVLTVVLWTSLAVFGLYVLLQVRTDRRFIPLIVLLPAASQFIWFYAPNVGEYAALVPFFHSLQYLLIAWSMQLAVGLGERQRSPSIKYVVSESTRWAAIVVVAGILLFWGLPQVGSHFGRSLQFSNAVLLSAIQIHHFFVDGVIWRLREPSVRSPLSTSLKALVGSTT